MSVEFIATTLLVVASPGTGVLYTLAAGLSRGARAGVIAAIGCTLGIVPHVTAAIVGLAAVLRASALAFETFKFLGVAYLIYLAWSTVRDRGSLKIEAGGKAHSAAQVTLTAILINLLNPKLSVFFLVFLPQFVNVDETDPAARMFALGAVFMATTFVVFTIYGLLASSVREHLIARPRVLTWIRCTFAGAFLLVGVSLAMAPR